MRIEENMDKWIRHISTSKFSLGAIKEVPFSFSNPIANAHFRFAFFILDVLGQVNELFQAKYSFVNYCWEWLLSLFSFLKSELLKMENGNWTLFPYINDVSLENRPQFVSIMKHLILNLSVRFFTVSFSLNKTVVRNHLDYENMSIGPLALLDDGSRCGLSALFEIFNIRQTNTTANISSQLPHLRIARDWERLVVLLATHGGQVMLSNQQRAQTFTNQEIELRHIFEMPTTTNLIVVFSVVPKNHFGDLWRFVIRVQTIVPSTVGCEQTFSYFKRTNHFNVSDKTAQLFL